MADLVRLLLAAGVSLAVSLASPIVVRPRLERLGVVDVPSARSSHVGTVVRGLGLACVLAFVLVTGFVVLTTPQLRGDALPWAVLGGAAACSALGFAEDVRGVSIGGRFLIQLVIGIAVAAVMVDATGASPWFVLVGALVVPTLVNATNFMDGVNGISGLYGLVAGGYLSYVGVSEEREWLAVGGAVLAAAFVGFLPWNFGWFSCPASFMGDAGSYLLGGALACMAFGAFLSGVPIESVAGPFLIYLADTGFTLARRMVEGKAWMQSHREHAYQRLTDVGFSHVGSALTVIGFTALTCLFGSAGAAQANQRLNTAAFATVVTIAVYLCLPWLVSVLGRRRRTGAPSSVRPPSEESP